MTVLPPAGHNDLFEKGAWEKIELFLESLRPVPVPVAAKAGRPVEIAAAASVEDR
jgi:hypothetical protein